MSPLAVDPVRPVANVVGWIEDSLRRATHGEHLAHGADEVDAGAGINRRRINPVLPQHAAERRHLRDFAVNALKTVTASTGVVRFPEIIVHTSGAI